MTSQQPPAKEPWVNTTLGIVVVNGVIVAVVSALVTWVINNAGTLPWDSILLTFGVVAVAVFLLLSVFRKSLRHAIWRRPAIWVWSWHPISARRHSRELLNLAEGLIEVIDGRANVIAQKAIQESEDLAKAKKELASLWAKAKLKAEGSDKAESRITIDTGADVRSEVQASPVGTGLDPALPMPWPRWSVVRDNGDNNWILRNAVPRSVAREVRIESDGDMTILSAGHWADLSGAENGNFGDFVGSLTPRGHEFGVRFHVTWYDEKNVRQEAFVDLPGTGVPF